MKENSEYTWFVDATDGIDTISSNKTFKFKTPMVRYYAGIPDRFRVEQNYPNPFNQSTVIQFSVPVATQVNVKVYDITGREIIQLINNHLEAGYYTVTWDGKNNKGITAGSGKYLCIVKAGSYREVKKMVLLK